jgi:hypothetical protein
MDKRSSLLDSGVSDEEIFFIILPPGSFHCSNFDSETVKLRTHMFQVITKFYANTSYSKAWGQAYKTFYGRN